MHYVYKITNTINGKFYIGKRKHANPYNDIYMGSGSQIKSAIKKYGKSVFVKEILSIFQTNEEAAEFEKQLVTKELIESAQSYNMHEGGHGGFLHINNLPISERINFKRIKELKDNGNCNWGGTQNWSQESYRKVREQGNKNRELGLCSSKGHKKKIGHAKGSKNSQYGKVWCVQKNAIDCFERKSFKKENIPEDWITTAEWKDLRKDKTKSSYGRSWYNDGINNYYLKPEDELVSTLIKGRIMVVNFK